MNDCNICAAKNDRQPRASYWAMYTVIGCTRKARIQKLPPQYSLLPSSLNTSHDGTAPKLLDVLGAPPRRLNTSHDDTAPKQVESGAVRVIV